LCKIWGNLATKTTLCAVCFAHLGVGAHVEADVDRCVEGIALLDSYVATTTAMSLFPGTSYSSFEYLKNIYFLKFFSIISKTTPVFGVVVANVDVVAVGILNRLTVMLWPMWILLQWGP
jgi:hypothetical protein